MKLYDSSDINDNKIPARSIKSGDILMTVNGTAEVSSVTTEPYNGYVYNYIFEEDSNPNFIQSNGYWSGELYAQNDIKPRTIYDEEKAQIEQMKKLFIELCCK